MKLSQITEGDKTSTTHQGGEVTHTGNGIIHKSNNNYSGRGHRSSDGARDNTEDPKLKLPSGGKQGGSFTGRMVDESGPSKHEVPAALRKKQGGDWKTTTADLKKDAEKSPTTKKGLEDRKSQKGIKETTGDERFDNIMGKMTAPNATPQVGSANRTDKVIDQSENPDPDLINTLNDIMFNMHKLTQEANAAIRKAMKK